MERVVRDDAIIYRVPYRAYNFSVIGEEVTSKPRVRWIYVRPSDAA